MDHSRRIAASRFHPEMQDLSQDINSCWIAEQLKPGTPSGAAVPSRAHTSSPEPPQLGAPLQQPVEASRLEMYRELETLSMALQQERQEKAALAEEKAVKEAQYQRDIAELEGMLRQVTTEKDRIMARNVHLTAELSVVKGAFLKEAASPLSQSIGSALASTASGVGGYSEMHSEIDRSFRESVCSEIDRSGKETERYGRPDTCIRKSQCAGETYRLSVFAGLSP